MAGHTLIPWSHAHYDDGASSRLGAALYQGVGGFVREVVGGLADCVYRPCVGVRQDGLVGGARGVVTGLASLLQGPLKGASLLARKVGGFRPRGSSVAGGGGGGGGGCAAGLTQRLGEGSVRAASSSSRKKAGPGGAKAAAVDEGQKEDGAGGGGEGDEGAEEEEEEEEEKEEEEEGKDEGDWLHVSRVDDGGEGARRGAGLSSAEAGRVRAAFAAALALRDLMADLVASDRASPAPGSGSGSGSGSAKPPLTCDVLARVLAGGEGEQSQPTPDARHLAQVLSHGRKNVTFVDLALLLLSENQA